MKDLKQISIEFNHLKRLEGDFESETIPPYDSASSILDILKKEYEYVIITICPPCEPSLSLKLCVEDDAMDLLYVAEDSVDLHTVSDWVVGGIFDDGYLIYRAERQGGGDVEVNLELDRSYIAAPPIKYRWKVDAKVLDNFWRTLASTLVSTAQQMQREGNSPLEE